MLTGPPEMILRHIVAVWREDSWRDPDWKDSLGQPYLVYTQPVTGGYPGRWFGPDEDDARLYVTVLDRLFALYPCRCAEGDWCGREALEASYSKRPSLDEP
jgi:hypothetical protein